MRVALICEVYLPKIDGVVIRTISLITELLKRGDEVLVICPRMEGARNSAAPVIDFPSFPFPSYPEYRIGIPNHELIQAVRRFSPMYCISSIHLPSAFVASIRLIGLVSWRHLFSLFIRSTESS